MTHAQPLQATQTPTRYIYVNREGASLRYEWEAIGPYERSIVHPSVPTPMGDSIAAKCEAMLRHKWTHARNAVAEFEVVK